MLKAAVTNLISRKARGWAFRRQGLDQAPVTIDKRRTYIFPTRLGMVYGLMVFAMLLGSMNYNNSMGMALTFMLAGLGLVAMHQCHRNLAGTVVRYARAEPVFVGQTADFRIVVENPSTEFRYELVLRYDGEVADVVDVAPGDRAELHLRIPTRRRGRLSIERYNLSTVFPLGLLRAWTWVHMDLACIVYPKPAERSLPAPPERTDTGGAQNDLDGEEDFAGLRNFRPGDSPRHVAWKAFAKGEGLLVKQYAGTDVTTHWFDWDKLPMSDTERRLSQLCRWIVDAHRDGHAYGLRVPGIVIEPNIGRAHLERCLSLLALFPGQAPPGEAR